MSISSLRSRILYAVATAATALFVLVLTPAKACDLAKAQSELQSAKTLLFYAMSASNSRIELDQAQLHLEAAESLLQACSEVNNLKRKQHWEQLLLMKEDLASRKSIAKDNLNFRLPLYDVMFGHREDFNTVDDHGEVLLEDLCERMLQQPSDQRALWNVPSVHSWVVFNSPTGAELHNVAIEYLSEHSGQYVLQLMEYPAEYFTDFPQNDSVSIRAWHAQLAAQLAQKFKLNSLYLFAFENKADMNDLALKYMGVSVLKFDAKTSQLSPLLYLEGFKADKKPAFRRAIALLVGYLLLVFGIGMALEKMPGRPQKFGKSSSKLVGAMAVFALVFAGTLALGRVYGANPVEYAGSAWAMASIGLYPVLLPVLLLIFLHVYRTIAFKGAEMETDLRAVYWVGLGLIPSPLITFAYFKSPASDWWLPLLGLPVYLLAVLAMSKALRQSKSHAATAIQTWLALGLSVAGIVLATFVLQAFPDSWFACSPLLFAALLPVIAHRIVLPSRNQPQQALSPEKELNFEEFLKHYPGLNLQLNAFVNDAMSGIAELRIEAGWGRTTALQDEVIPFLRSKKYAVVSTDVKSSQALGQGHVLLAESLRSQDKDFANIIHDATANQSLNLTQKVVKFVLSIFTDTDPTPAFDRLRKFEPEQTAFELLDYLANQFTTTVYWWVDDAELLDEAALEFLVVCMAHCKQRRRKDGSPLLKIMLSPAGEEKVPGLEQALLAAKVPLMKLQSTGIAKQDLAMQLLQQAYPKPDGTLLPLATELQETLKELMHPILEEGGFNLNAIKALIEHLIDSGQIELKQHRQVSYRNGLTQVTEEWVATQPIQALPLEAMAAAFNRQVDQTVQLSDETQQLLQIAAAVGLQFDIRVIARASNRQTHEALMFLEPAEMAGLVWDDAGEDYVYHFRSRHLKEQRFKEPKPGESQMKQLDRELLRTTGRAAEDLFREFPEELPLLQTAAHQFWILNHTPSHREHAIRLYNELAEHCESSGNADLYGTCMERLLDLTNRQLSVRVKHTEHALNSFQSLPESTFLEATEQVLQLDQPTQDGAELCLLLLTSLHRARRDSDPRFDQIALKFEALCPQNAPSLRLRRTFMAVYFGADLSEHATREHAVEQLLDLAGQIPTDASPELRSLLGEIWNSAAGILIDVRHKDGYGDPKRGLQLLEQRLQLLTGNNTDSLSAAISRFVTDELVVQKLALQSLTWSECKSLAFAVNFAVRGLFKLEQLDATLALKAWKINAYVKDFRGQINALSYVGWQQVRAGEFDGDLAQNIEDQLQLTKTPALRASSIDYLFMLALALAQEVHATEERQVGESTIDSCLNRFLKLLTEDEKPAQKVYISPPGQEQHAVRLICEHRATLLKRPTARRKMLDHKAFVAIEALNALGNGLDVPTDCSLHLLRHFTSIPDGEASELAAKSGLSRFELKAHLNLPGSHFFESGPLSSLEKLKKEVERILQGHLASVDFFRSLDAGKCQIGLAFEFKEPIGEDGIIRLDATHVGLVRYETRGEHTQVPVVKSPAPVSRWLRFIVLCDPAQGSVTLVTAFSGSYAPPFGNEDFWAQWALLDCN